MPRPINPDDLLSLARLGAPSASTDGSRVVVPITRMDGDANRAVTQLALLDGDGLRPLTRGPSASAPRVAPNGSAVAFLRNVDDRPQLHLLSLAGGEARALTELPLGVLAARWTPDSSRLVVAGPLSRRSPTIDGTLAVLGDEEDDASTARVTEARYYRYWDRWLTDDRCHHLFVVDPAEPSTPHHLSPGLDGWLALGPMVDAGDQIAISPSGRALVVSLAAIEHGEDPAPRYGLWHLALEGEPAVHPLTPANPAGDTGPCFIDEDAVLFGARREPNDYASPPVLTRLDLGSGAQTPLTAEWDLSPASWQVDGDRALIVAEDRARARVFALELAGGAPTPLTELTDGSVSSPTVAGDRILALRQSIARPAELVALGREEASGVEPVHDPNAERIADLELNAPEELFVKGARGDEVQIFVLRPPGAPPREESDPLPLVHMIHGGPHGTFGDVWHYRWNAQAFAAPGFLVAMVNFHGSSSFGHEKTRSIQGAWGDMPFTDIEAATDVLVERGDADPERMAISGGSYGGYLAAWIPTRTSRYRCAIAHAAVTNLGAMLATDWPVGLARAYGADPVTDPAKVARWSPAHHFAEHETPTLVIHGEKDYRVPYTQGLELYAALRSKGVPARLVVFPDENHWILAPANARRWYGEVQTWLERHLFPNRHP